MKIHAGVCLTNDTFSGYVNVDGECAADTSQPAEEALVFMINRLNNNWKLPVGYFLIKVKILKNDLTIIQGVFS